VAEIVCRIDKLFPGKHFSSTGAHAWFKARAEAGSGRELEAFAAADPRGKDTSLQPFPHPFDGWADARELVQLEDETRWYADPASQKTFDVLILGGSVAAVFGNLSPPRLISTLRQDPRLRGRGIRVWNGGNAGYKAPQPLHLFEWMLTTGHRPDAIVMIDGFNEVCIAANNISSHVHPLYPYAEHWGPLVLGKDFDLTSLDLLVAMRMAQKSEQSIARAALASGFENSALLTRITLARLASRRRAFEEAKNQYVAYCSEHERGPVVHGPTFEGGVDQAIDLAVTSWSESAAAVHALCVAHGIIEVHVLQPSIADEGSKVPTEEEKHSAWTNDVWQAAARRGYPLLRAAGEKLRANGIPFDDATRIFEHESATVYTDLCHLTEHGNDLLCSYVLGLIDQRLE
jgi:hypothetical protein